MSIKLPFDESTSEKLCLILRSHKIRSTFYTENTFHDSLYKSKDRIATEDKNNIVYQIDCSNCEAVFFGESKRSLKLRSDKPKRSVRDCECYKNQTAKHCWEAYHNFSWDQKKLLIGKAGQVLGRSKKPHILWRILVTLTKIPTCFLKFGFLIYGSSLLLIRFILRF